MSRKTLFIAGLAAALTLSTMACGGGGDDDGQGTSSGDQQTQQPANNGSSDARVDTCKLVTGDDVATAIGEPVKDGKEGVNNASGNVSIHQCVWLPAADGSDASASIFVRTSNAKDAAAAYDQAKKEFSDAKDVSGVGDKAYWVPSTGQLNFIDGDSWFIVSAHRKGEKAGVDPTDASRALAGTVVKNHK